MTAPYRSPCSPESNVVLSVEEIIARRQAQYDEER